MTQEELDALMAGGFDDELDGATDDIIEESPKQEQKKSDTKSKDNLEEMSDEINSTNYRADSMKSWPPPPPTDDHKVVNQLDDVTRDSEVKATEMMDKLETMSNFFADSESQISSLVDIVSSNIELFTTLSEKFPNVETFKNSLEQNNALKDGLDEVISNLQMGQDEVMMAMDAMQYQDIHRQKIERVINVMRALSKYMNSLFEGRIDDEKRVSSAVHIEGDSTADVVSNEDIEALIASLGKQ